MLPPYCFEVQKIPLHQEREYLPPHVTLNPSIHALYNGKAPAPLMTFLRSVCTRKSIHQSCNCRIPPIPALYKSLLGLLLLLNVLFD